MISLPENDAILAQLKRLTPLAKAMLVPDLTEDEIKAALGEDEVWFLRCTTYQTFVAL